MELTSAYKTQSNSQAKDNLWGRALDKLRSENPNLVADFEVVVESAANIPANLGVKEQFATVVATTRRSMTNKQWTFQWRGKPKKSKNR